jgi:transposase
MSSGREFPDELRERAVRLVREAREQGPALTINAAVQRIAR